MIRRTTLLLGLAALVASLLAGCSSSDGGGGATTTTEDPKIGMQADKLAAYARDLEAHTNGANAAFDSPAARYAQWVTDYDDQNSITMRDVGDAWQVCGAGQAPGSCATLTDFTFDSGNNVQSFRFEGTPIGELVSGEGAQVRLSTGKIAGVGLREAFLNPKDRRLYVAMQVLWNDEITPDTNGCDPSKATYSTGGPVADPLGGGKAGDITDVWLMTMSFPDAGFGGELKVPCFRQDGASEVFTFTILQPA